VGPPNNKNELMLLLQPHILIHGCYNANSKKTEKRKEKETEREREKEEKKTKKEKEIQQLTQ